MSYRSGPGGDDQQPTVCPADGPVEPGRSVVEAVECNTARFVDLSGVSGGVTPVHLVVSGADGETTTLERTQVLSLPELQNGLAYFGPDVDSVRVRTHPDRRVNVREHVTALEEQSASSGFEFGGREFSLAVQLG
jgi:hypothetical protein